ncbi:GNAT family N-acetyltransferase [Hahella sp. CR1]|uniref:GNAT family N-acetyltransferase n=1 Tax=Hahella sp. CR1 TaxID=2992807 RepID=UPI0024419A5D|nr:GNAT family N-acetyltransferase [Hahella sp. CR1]MDG9666699.1 GNAT family N-acetyltransferase [Hahella sp. CR1]
MNVVLRPATAADADTVTDIMLASRKKFLAYAPMAHSEREVRGWVRYLLLPRESVTLAVADERIAGFLSLDKGDRLTWLTQFYLAPDYVGRGIGSQLLTHVLSLASKPVRLHCFQQNQDARRFYERHGFVPVRFTDGSGNEERCPDVLYELA